MMIKIMIREEVLSTYSNDQLRFTLHNFQLFRNTVMFMKKTYYDVKKYNLNHSINTTLNLD